MKIRIDDKHNMNTKIKGASHEMNCISDVVVRVLVSSVVGQGQTNDYEIGICCFSSKHAAQRSKSKDWLAQNKDNVSEWSIMSTCVLLFH